MTDGQRDLVWICFFACLCIYPWRNGYFLLLDFVSIPGREVFGSISRDTPLLHIIGYLVRDFLGPIFHQYIVFTWALVLLGRGVARMLRFINIHGFWLRFGVLFAMCNPFIYTRMIEGQSNVFLWYWLLFLALSYIYQALMQVGSEQRKLLLIWSVIAGLAVSYFIHSIFIVALLSTAILLIPGSFFARLSRWIMSLWIVVCINLNWILWWVFGIGSQTLVMEQFNIDHYRVFDAVSPSSHTPFHLASLHWFWSEGMQRYTNWFSYNDRRQYMFGIIALCMLVWFMTRIYIYPEKQKLRHFTWWLTGVWIISYVLSMWWSGRWWVQAMTSWMYEHIPFYSGLREPQKRMWVVLFCYCVFGAWWVQYILQKIDQFSQSDKLVNKMFGVFFAILPLLYTPTMLFAMKWQLTVHQYPSQRTEAKSYLFDNIQNTIGNDCVYEQCYDVLMFPWHQYLRLNRGRNVVANPMWGYFWYQDGQNLSLLIGDNMEMHDVYTQSSRPASKAVEYYIWPDGVWRQEWSSNVAYDIEFVQEMKKRWVSYIVLFREAKWEPYQEKIEDMIDEWLMSTVLDNEMLSVHLLE